MRPLAIFEGVVIVALAGALLWPVRGRLREVAAAIPRRYVLLCLLGGMLLLGGQMISSGETSYPFPDWDMYTVSNPADPRFVDYMAELSSGREVRLLIGQLFPAGGRHFRARIDKAAYATDTAQGGSNDAQAAADLDALLAAVTREYNARHPGDPVRTIRLWVGTVPARSYKGPASISKHLLREYHAP
jgi:hypothetical protein